MRKFTQFPKRKKNPCLQVSLSAPRFLPPLFYHNTRLSATLIWSTTWLGSFLSNSWKPQATTVSPHRYTHIILIHSKSLLRPNLNLNSSIVSSTLKSQVCGCGAQDTEGRSQNIALDTVMQQPSLDNVRTSQAKFISMVYLHCAQNITDGTTSKFLL